jgi:ribosomal protein L32
MGCSSLSIWYNNDMAPTPKRRKSHKSTKRRERSKNLDLPQLVIDKETNQKRLPHRPVKDRI